MKRDEIDWDSVFMRLPEIMGLPRLVLRGRYWYGPYRLNGEPHDRVDKMVIKQGLRDRMPIILEQGGDSVTLWSWLVTYGCLDNRQVNNILRGIEKVELVFNDFEYVGPVKYVEPWRFIEEGGASNRWFCPLFGFLSQVYDPCKVITAFRKYNVSTGLKSKNTHTYSTRFWYKDMEGRICYDKSMFYGYDGHRLKDERPMRKYKRNDGYTGSCFFGEDTLVEGRPVFVVESEKSAIICHLEYPDFNWVACGGKNNLDMLDRLRNKGYDVYLVPDVDAVDEWTKMGKVWPWWERCGINVGEKWDIADYILIKRLTL